MHISLVDWAAVLFGNFLAAALFVGFIQKAAFKVLPSRQEAIRVATMAACYMLGWYVLYLVLASRGIFQYRPQVPFPFLGIAFTLPFFGAVFAASFWKPLRRVIAEIPQQDLIGPQFFRIIGFTFLLLMGKNLLPPQFALPAGIGDILVGLDALLVARMYVRGTDRASAFALAWNVFGIIDLFVAVGIGFFGSTSPLRLLDLTPRTDLMTSLPMVMVPVFAVPFYLVLHFMSIRRAWAAVRRQSPVQMTAVVERGL